MTRMRIDDTKINVQALMLDVWVCIMATRLFYIFLCSFLNQELLLEYYACSSPPLPPANSM
jgi:hypothetical protein